MIAVLVAPGAGEDYYAEAHRADYFRREGRYPGWRAILSPLGGVGLALKGWESKGEGQGLAVAPALPAFGRFLLLAADARRLEVLPAAYLRENAVLLNALVEALQKTLEGLAFS